MGVRRALVALLLVACASRSGAALFEAEFAAQKKANGLREAVPVASVVGDAYWPSASPDGSCVVFTAAQNGTIDVWKKVLATGETIRLTRHSADDEDPAISPDGKTIAFVSRRDDAKGDIFLMDIDGKNERRMTDEATSERAPMWAPDGKSLLLSLRTTPDVEEDVFRLDLDTKKLTRLTEGGGFDASLDPSGGYLIYSQRSQTKDGRTTTRIVGKRLKDDKIKPLGDGRRPEAFARVATIDGKVWVYFTRYVEDDTRDGRIDVDDAPSLYRVHFRPEIFDGGETADYSEPISSGINSETLASVSGDKVFHVVALPPNGSLEIQTLPPDGMVPQSMSTQALLDLADSDIPGRIRRYLFRMVMARGGPEALKARYELARDFAGEGRLEDAQAAFERVVEIAGPLTPIGRLGRLEQLRNQFFLNQQERQQTQAALTTLRDRVRELAPPDGSKLVLARANVVLAEAAEAAGNYAQGLEQALAVPRDREEYGEDAARAMRVEARISSVALPEEEEQRRLIVLMRENPRQVRELKAARARFFELMPKDPQDRIAVIDRLLPLAQDLLPLAVQIVLTQSEALGQLGQVGLAVEQLERMLAKKELQANDRGRLLFALAKTQELKGDLAPALKSFETLMNGAQFNRVQRDRARVELLRLALKKARADEARGDTNAAYEAYRTLAKNNFAEAGAHRKVLQLGDRLGLAKDLARDYRAIAKERPFDRVAQYAAALAATYVGDITEAETGFQKAIDLDAAFAYAHLGLGWVYEQREYRDPGTSDALERALYEYQTALSLFETAREQDVIPEAALNLGNAFARIGQFEQAFAQYLVRELSHAPFTSTAQEIIFRERFGQAAVRTGEYDVALMSLRDGIRLAEREGDDRRLGRMRALLALTYDGLEMENEARASLVRARDEYATRGDFNRVVAIDRTIGWLALAGGDEDEALAALDRSLELIRKGYGPAGFKFGVTFRPIGLIQALAVDGNDTSRAPYGFSTDDEREILESLLGRIYARLGDTQLAAQYLERRLAVLTKTLGDGDIGEFVQPEWYAATAELMLLCARRQAFSRASELFVTAAEHYAKAKTSAPKWILPVVAALGRVPIVTLDAEHLEKHDAGVLALVERLRAAPKLETDKGDKKETKSGGASKPANSDDAKKENVEEEPEIAEARRRALGMLERSRRSQALLLAERDARSRLAVDAKAAAETLPAVLNALDVDLGGATATSLPASQPASQPTVVEKGMGRSTALARAAALIDAGERAAMEGRFADAEAAFTDAMTLRRRFSLFDVEWQIEYARYRVGPVAERPSALGAAALAVRDADVLARLLYPDRPRPPLWRELMRAMLADAIDKVATAPRIAEQIRVSIPRDRLPAWYELAQAWLADTLRKPELSVAEIMERMSIESVTLPDGLARPDLSGAESSRAALATWAERTNEIIEQMSKRSTERLEASLQQQIAKGLVEAKNAAEPWASLLACRVDPKRVSDALGAGETGDTFDWYVPGHELRLTLKNGAFVLLPRVSAASQPASAVARLVRYVAGDGDAPDRIRVASANGLWLALAARNSNNGDPVDFAVAAPQAQKIVDSAVPPKVKPEDRLRGADVDRESLGRSARKSLVRLTLQVVPFEGAPGAFRFAIAGGNALEQRLKSVSLPRLAINPNFAVIDSLQSIDEQLGANLSRAFALAGTPSLLVCAPDDPETHAQLLKVFYEKRVPLRAAEAWIEAVHAQSSSKWQAAAARCQYWGFASDGEAQRKAFARRRMGELEDLGNKAKGAGGYAEAKTLFQQALDYAEFLSVGASKEDAAKLEDVMLRLEATLAQTCAFKGDDKDAIKFQKSVIKKWEKKVEEAPERKKDLAEAWNLLGVIQSRAREPEDAAASFAKSIELFNTLKAAMREAQAWQQRGTALAAAGAYRDAVDAYQKSAAAFKALDKPPMQATSLRYAGIILENNLSEFAEALAVFLEQLKIGDALGDKAVMTRARLDVGRVQRQLAEYDAASKTIQKLLELLPKDDYLTRCEATLELARIYWYANDNERALVTEGRAKKLDDAGMAEASGRDTTKMSDPEKNKRRDDIRRAEFLSIQAVSLEGLILMSQGKRVAASNRFRKALKLARTSRRREEESSQLNNFGFTLRERGMLDAAGKAFVKAIAIDTELKSKDGLAFDFRNLAAIRLRQGNLREAKQFIAQARELNAVVKKRYNQMNIELVDGELGLVEKRYADSRRAFTAAMDEAMKLKSRDIEWKSRLGLALDDLQDEKGDKAAAKKQLEKAIDIVEALGPKLDDVKSAEERTNELTMARLNGTLAALYAKENDVDGMWRLLERLRLKELRDQISPYTWTIRLGVGDDDANDYKKLTAAARAKNDTDLLPLLTLEPVPLEALRKARPKDAIVALRVFDRALVGVIADDRGARTKRVQMSKEEVLAKADAWMDAVDSLQPAPAEAKALLDGLAGLFDEDTVKKGRVLLVADSTLTRLPWASLPLKNLPLIDSVSLSFEISGTHAARAAGPLHAVEGAIVAVGPQDGDDLPFAQLEVDESVALFGELGRQVTKKSLAEFYNSTEDPSPLWHVALHGNSLSRTMQGSFLKSGDTNLFAVELLEQRRRVPTVVLSACRRQGSDPQGVEFVSALRLSGTDRVIVPASRVFDDQSALFVKHVVRLLAEGGGIEGLRALQRQALARGEPASVWASWQWYGKVE